MNKTSNDLYEINKITEPLLGQVARNVELSFGSFITMEFGDIVSVSSGKSHGEWYLWIYSCGWFLEKPGNNYLGSEDPREILKQEVKVFEGRILRNIIISSLAFDTKFVFDGGFVLHTFPLSFLDDSPCWKLFTPDGKVLLIGQEGKWFYQPSSAPRP